MALVIADRVKETSTTAGTGTVVLAGASAGYQSFAVIGNNNTTFYTIADQGGGTNWEVGIGTYYSGNLSLARTTILASSNSNTAVSFGSNTKDVFVTYPAEYAIYNNTASITTIPNLVSSNVAITGGSINNVLIGNATANTAVFTTLTASSNITTTGYTGYLYGNNSAVVTASTTIPSSAITGLGTMASQNANNVNITGGSVTANLAGSGAGISALNGSNVASGTVPVLYGGTGTSTATGTTTSSVVLSNAATLTNVTISSGSINATITGSLNASNVNAGTLLVNYGGTGLNSLTNNSVMVGNATNAVKFVAPGTTGNVLTSDGTSWTSSAPAASGLTGLSNASILNLNVNLTANATINAGVNGFSVGPVNTANGVTITITSGQRWVII